MTATEVKQIPKSVNNINQSQKDIQRSPICITNYDHYYIIDDTKQRDKIWIWEKNECWRELQIFIISSWFNNPMFEN